MSEINQDVDVVNQGRTNKLKDAEAPLRDRINQALYDKLVEMNIGQKVTALWMKGSANRQRWLERQKGYLASWDEHLVGNTDGSFEGSSQLHIPMPFIVCKTLHARYNQAIWQDPPFNVKARNEASTDNTQIVNDTLRYYIMDGANNNKGLEEEVDKWLWRWITNGTGLLKMGWAVKYSRFVDVAQVPEPGKPKVSRDQTGKQVVTPTTKMTEKEISVTKKTFEGPMVTPVNVEDLLIVGGQGDPDAAEAVIEQQWLTASELWTFADQKIFKEDIVEQVIQAGKNRESGTIASELKTQRLQNAGKTSLDLDTDLDKYHIFEAYLQVDVDGSGINTDVVVWVHNQTKAILRATYLHRISPKGERPYAKADFHIRDGQEYGIGMPELLYPLSQEMDAMHNMRIDFGLISVMPFGFYRSSSGIDPETIKFEPGSLIPVDNPQSDVYFPNMGNRTVFGMQEENALQTIVERITSISDLNLGLQNGQGATRTATGARALVSEMSSNLDIYLRRLNRGWRKVLRYTFHLLQKRIPAGLSYRLTGDDGADYWRYIQSKEDIEGDFDIEVSPNTSTSNPGVQQDNAQQILQVVQNPLLLQLHIVGPGQLYEAARNHLQALGVKDYSKYIVKPQGYERMMSPEEEANRVLRGEVVKVQPGADHQGFMDFYQHFHDTDELCGQFSKEQMGLLKIQMMKHQSMQRAIEHQQAQAANLAQMHRNAQMGAQQTSLSPTGGGGAAPQPSGPPQQGPANTNPGSPVPGAPPSPMAG